MTLASHPIDDTIDLISVNKLLPTASQIAGLITAGVVEGLQIPARVDYPEQFDSACLANIFFTGSVAEAAIVTL